MYRINSKPWVDRSIHNELTQNYYEQTNIKASNLFSYPKRPYIQQFTSDSKSRDNLEHSPLPKTKKRTEVPLINPTYRSANFTKPSYQQPRQTSTSQSFRVEKPGNIENSLQDIPVLTKESTLPYYEPTKCSSNRNGIIKAYAANTNQGIVRDYNEDRSSHRVDVLLIYIMIANENWPKCSFFGVYDGHGGAKCADFLRDNLHQFVIRELDFPWNPYDALRKGFEAAEKNFLDSALQSYARGVPERSGSCAIVSLVVGDTCYIANVGDSRAVMSGKNGKQVYNLSRDHKPCDELEQQRIQLGGGKIYQTQGFSGPEEDQQIILGPLRVLPGRLSVSRTFGDIEAKLEKFGGNIKVVVAEPEIKSFKIQAEHDFIVLASDGIFDKMSSADVLKTIWDDMSVPTSEGQNLHAQISCAVEAVLKESINRRTYDNITVVMVAFSKEDELRPKSGLSYERQQNSQSISPTPIQKITNQTFHGVNRDEKPNQQVFSAHTKPLICYSKPMRSSLESIEHNKKTQQNQLFSFMKQKEQDKTKTSNNSQQITKPSYSTQQTQDENQENTSFPGNKLKEMRQTSHLMDLKLSNEFRQIPQIKRPAQMHDYTRYQGRIF